MPTRSKEKSMRPQQEPAIYAEELELPSLSAGAAATVSHVSALESSARIPAWLWVFLASLFGLAIGIMLAMLLASGELDLSLKDVKLLFKGIRF